jgi:hypothetical protein
MDQYRKFQFLADDSCYTVDVQHLFYILKKLIKLTKFEISMESNTFARTSARRYRIVNAEERSQSILFNTISSFCDLKSNDINKTNININYEEDTTLNLLSLTKKKAAKTEYV